LALGVAPGELLVDVRGMVRLELPAPRLQLREAQEAGLAIAPEPARVVVHDPLEPRALRAHVEQLVHLLLVLGNREAGLGMVEDVGELALDRVLVERDRHAAEGLRGHGRPVELRPVVAHDRGLVAAREAERREAERDEPGLGEVLGPRPGLPDPVVLLAGSRPCPGSARRSA